LQKLICTLSPISDGGNGLEDFFSTYFPKAECILDFWHAKEYLVELGKVLHPSDEETRKRWTDEVCQRLKHEGGLVVRADLEALDLSVAPAEVREVHRRTIQYFRNHEHRMDYPRYVRNSSQIGSALVESACKTVAVNRLKGGACDGDSPAPTRFAACEPCTSANPPAGTRSGARSPISRYPQT